MDSTVSAGPVGVAEPVGHVGLDDAAVEQCLTRLDELLERIEAMPGPTAEMALEAVETLAEVYGTALARVMALAADLPGPAGPAGSAGAVGFVDALVGDELLRHLLVLHGIHPDPVEERVARAVEEVRPYVRSRGGEVELTEIEDGVARLRLTAGGCGSTSAALADAVTESLLAAAPELVGVDPVRVVPRSAPALIPVESLMRRPAATGGPP